ncbi:MAG TPA: type II secretion system F family protein [Candidatus Binataceae bacterium]|nr:type II secretion system F family protein [Candidatus Binataceae bacterium]
MANGALPAAVTVFILSVASAIALYRALFGGQRMRDDRLLEPSYRLGESSASILRGQVNTTGFSAGLVDAMTRRFSKPAGLTPSQRRIATTLSHAGFNGFDKLVIFRLIQLSAVAVCGFAGAGVGSLFGDLGWQMALFCGTLAYFLSVRILRRMARNRQVRIIHELPATLDLLTVCLEAGLGLAEALRLVSRRAERRGGVLGVDLGIMTGELSAGVPLSDALRNLADRAGTEDLKSVSALLIQSAQMGTRLAPALRASAEQFATRRRMRAEERAQKASVKMLVPLVLLILPAMLIVVLGPAFLQIITTVGK